MTVWFCIPTWLLIFKWLFTYKQHAWGPPPFKQYMKNWSVTLTDQNSQASFAKKLVKKVEIITRTPAELRPSDFSLRFLAKMYLISAEFKQTC